MSETETITTGPRGETSGAYADTFEARREAPRGAPPGTLHSLRHIVAGLSQDAQDLVRGEIALARAEADQKIDRTIMAMVWVFGGMLLAFAALVIFAEAAIDALSFVLSIWASCLIIGAVVGVVGAVLARTGIRMLSLARLKPHRTTRNLERDAEVVREHT